MALRRTIAKRLLKHQPPAISDPLTATKSYIHRQWLTSPHNPSPPLTWDSSGGSFTGKKINQSSTMNLPELFPFPTTAERRLEHVGMSVKDIRKILRYFQLENVRMALRRIPTNSISYSEFLTVCTGSCADREQGLELSKLLDEGGDVIVLGNLVLLRPDQLTKSMEELISQSITINPNDPRRQQLEELERQKSFIDQKSLSQVRGELYCGLGFLIIQTLAFMRLTFWELGWDVMELYASLSHLFTSHSSRCFSSRHQKNPRLKATSNVGSRQSRESLWRRTVVIFENITSFVRPFIPHGSQAYPVFKFRIMEKTQTYAFDMSLFSLGCE